jgi:hypothetical protein
LAALLLLGSAQLHAADQASAPTANHPAAATDPQIVAAAARCARLVRQLGDEGFTTRNAAADELLRLGETARPAIAAAIGPPTDPEIRDRCRQILAALDVRRQRAKLAEEEARLVALLNDDHAADHHYDLPGWQRFRSDVGTSRDARELFAQMLRSERALLTMADACNDREQLRTLNDELQREIGSTSKLLPHPVPQFRAQVTPGRVAALVFVASMEGVELPNTSSSLLYSTLLQSRSRTATADAPGNEPMRQIVRHWVLVEQPGDANLPYYKMLLAVQFDIKEGVELARRIIREPNRTTRPHEFMQAITAICRFGAKDQIPDLETLLTNHAICYTLHINSKQYTTEVRDVALAALVHLTGQKHADYGMDRVQLNPQTVFAPHTVGFAKDEEAKRIEAFAKWDRWKAGQKRIPATKSGPPKASEPN